MNQEVKSKEQSTDTWQVMREYAQRPIAKEQIIAGQVIPCWPCMRVNNMYQTTSYYCNHCNRGFCQNHGNFARGIGVCIYCGQTKAEILEQSERFKSFKLIQKGQGLLRVNGVYASRNDAHIWITEVLPHDVAIGYAILAEWGGYAKGEWSIKNGTCNFIKNTEPGYEIEADEKFHITAEIIDPETVACEIDGLRKQFPEIKL